MSRGSEYTFFHRRHKNGKQVHEEYSTSLIVRAMQVKTTMRGITSNLLEWLLTKRQEMTNIGKDVEKGNSCALLVGK